MRTISLVAASAAALLAAGPQARAAVWHVDFSGVGVSASMDITAVPNVAPPDPNPSCGTPGNNPCRTDPIGAYKITGITGTFSDANTATPITDALITGLVPINPANERDATFDPLVPSSLSFIDYTNETSPGTALSYNNLFFPAGSPIDCDFPFTGTLLDVFGVAFTLDDGDTAVLWGDGNYLFGPLTYGAAVTDGINRLDYQFGGVSRVPEPGAAWLLVSGVVGLLGWRGRSAAARGGITG